MYQNEGKIREHVIDLAEFLAKCGVKCDIASYYLDENVNDWNDFIAECITRTEYILLVCTKKLNEKLTGQSHSRVEMAKSDGPYILSSTLKSLLENSQGTLPIILEKGNRNYIPMFLQSTTIYTISLDALSSAISASQEPKEILNDSKYKDLRSLVARLTGQSEVEKPEVAQQPPNLTSKLFCMLGHK